jgi:uncharacterized membrane protein YheB (UPF0754 family)
MALPRDLENAAHLAEALAAPGSPEDRFNYEAPVKKPYPGPIGFLRRHIFKLYVFTVFAGTALILGLDFRAVSSQDEFSLFLQHCKIISVPLVCMIFTWFHVWLALQMVFYPLEFKGCGRKAIRPRCLGGMPINGWQGIVPSKIESMATRAVEAMIGNIVTIEEFMGRVQPEHFYSQLQDVMDGITTEVLERVTQKRWPQLWAAIPDSVKAELKEQVLVETRQSFGPAIEELKANINSIINLKQMSVDALVSNPRMMVQMFIEIAPRELQFIQHVAAVLGCVLGLVQMGIYVSLTSWYMPYIMLPVSGLIIGYLTNWLALKMTFAPVWPHIFCCGYVNFQGVFLKRQREAAEKMSELICEKVVDSKAIFQYIVSSSPAGVDKLLDIYQRHLDGAVQKSLGQASSAVPTFVGQGIEDLKADIIDISLELLPQHTEAIERYMDSTMKVQETLSWRLARLQPPDFERIVHPIFEADEWMLMLVGAFLGVVIGILQAWALG